MLSSLAGQVTRAAKDKGAMADKNASVGLPSYQQIIDILPGPFVVIDRDYRIVAANASYRQRYAVTTDEVINRHCYEVSHDSTVPCSLHGEHCPIDHVFGKRESVQLIHIHYDRDRHPEQVRIQATPLFDESGEVLFMGEYLDPIPAVQEENAKVLIGRSRAILRLTSLLQRVAPTQTTVLLLGESGVGKECAAEYLHQYSNRSSGPLVIVDCGTLGENLMESELFGHERGAFTGATLRKKGLFEVAHGGTLFIDEVCELPLALQTKLLRVLETGRIRRIGGTEYIQVDVRVVAATNRDIESMVARGDFRKDLYYRLSAFPVQIPALRDHKDDIPAIAEYFLSRIEGGDRHLPLSPEVIEHLLDYEYPGNVRELRNIIERAAILASTDVLRPDHLVMNGGPTPEPTEVVAREADTRLITRNRRLNQRDVLNALRACNGHRGQAASQLGVSERTLYRYLKKMRMDDSA